MAGFFQKDDVSHGARVKPKQKVEAFGTCETCGLYEHGNSVKPFGENKKRIMIVTETPSEGEARKGKMWSGEQGQLLRSILRENGIDLNRDCVSTYAVRCGLPEDRNPQPNEIVGCRERLFKAIAKYEPRLVVSLGYFALFALIGHRMGDGLGGTLDRWRGAKIPYHEIGAWLCPTFHPVYVMASERNPNVELFWERDIKNAIRQMDKDIPSPVDEDSVDVLVEPKEIKDRLDYLVSRPSEIIAAVDWETTGLKPHAKGHKIYTAGFSTGEDNTFAFKVEPQYKERLVNIALSRNVAKVAANMKFEDTWARQCLGTHINNWYWDTMVAQHVIDNRRYITGLKFQSAVRYGVWDYDSEISPYLKAEDESNANAFNRIYQAPLPKLLKYNAMDCLLEYKLHKDQIPEVLEQGTMDGYMLLHAGILTLSDMEWRGLPVEDSHVVQEIRRLEQEVQEIVADIWKSKEGKHWKKKFGADANWNSNQQLVEVLSECGVVFEKKTASGQFAADKGVLELLAHPIATKILRARKLSKNGGTFLTNIRREAVGGSLHPVHNLHKVITFRSSCESPNTQNMPKRDEESMKIVRASFCAPKGKCIAEIDYSGVEVRVGCCYHRDKNMERYILDTSTDMHRDEACSVFCFDPYYINTEVIQGSDDQAKKYFKAIRNSAKNGWVFAQFYGDWYKACAKNIWNQISHWGLKAPDGRGLFEHLKKQGIRNLKDFETHLKECERKLWEERFGGYGKWKEKTWKKYMKQGYLDTYTGLRLSALASRNQILNAPIQGSAFHCLLWSAIEMNKKLKREKWETEAVAQIHDSCIFITTPDEIDELYKVAHDIMCVKIVKKWPWLVIPLEIDMDVTEPGGAWSEQESYTPPK